MLGKYESKIKELKVVLKESKKSAATEKRNTGRKKTRLWDKKRELKLVISDKVHEKKAVVAILKKNHE